MKEAIINFFKDEEGLTAVEYAIAGALVIGVAAGGFTTLGTNVDTQIGVLADCAEGDCASGNAGGGG
ncbi:MAG: Flp family type IVb pilin [Pseudomonadales bacterium]|nr:Flp family type IVb pilin [Pseudomonadales bacterium]